MAFTAAEEKALRTMLDEGNIRNVVERYFHSVDSYDQVALKSCFTPDAYFEFNSNSSDKTVLRGNDTITKYFHERRHHFKMRIHQICHLGITVNGDTAKVDTYGTSHILFEDRLSVRGLHYDDDLILGTDGNWRFSKRMHQALWQYNVAPVPPFTSSIPPAAHQAG